jgi:rare lipoprotein A
LIAASVLAGCAQQPVAPPVPQPPTTPAAPAAEPAPTTQPPTASPEKPSRPTERGRVSLYGADFAGRTTASGERFDPEALTMAHRTLPFGTLVRVTNLANNRSVDVKVNDRGPAASNRIADLSLAAARKIGMLKDGVVDAILEVVPSTDSP